MTANHVAAVLRSSAVVDLALGVFLALSTWDGLYESLDLPKPVPALPAQMGGIAVIALAFLLWLAASRGELTGPVATAAAVANGGSAVVIVLWLIARDRVDLAVDDTGIAILWVVAAVLALVALAQLAVARQQLVTGNRRDL